MRTVHKVRIVPDHAPDGMTEKAILVKNLGVPVEIALGRFEAADEDSLHNVIRLAEDEVMRRCSDGD